MVQYFPLSKVIPFWGSLATSLIYLIDQWVPCKAESQSHGLLKFLCKTKVPLDHILYINPWGSDKNKWVYTNSDAKLWKLTWDSKNMMGSGLVQRTRDSNLGWPKGFNPSPLSMIGAGNTPTSLRKLMENKEYFFWFGNFGVFLLKFAFFK